MVDKNKVQDKYSRAKAVLKSLNVDQYSLADKLGIKQGPVSLALNGKNEKTFLRIVALLEKEYGIIPTEIFDDPQTVSQGLQEQLAEIKADLRKVLEELAELRKEVRG